MMPPEQTSAYLARIGHEGEVEPCLTVLASLVRAHLFTVPFENLDLHLGLSVPLDVAAAFEKVVERRRGGYCYELNPLFHALLTALGFRSTLVASAVLLEGSTPHPFDHPTIVVHLEEDWHVDVGFARMMLPTPLNGGESGSAFVVRRSGEAFVVGDREGDLLRFPLKPVCLQQFETQSNWIQSSPDSPFTQGPLCTLQTPTGHFTLSKRRLKTVAEDRVEEIRLTESQRTDVLRERFGIDLRGARLLDSAHS